MKKTRGLRRSPGCLEEPGKGFMDSDNINDETGYTITEVARMVGLSQKRIRDYEKEGFLKPKREAGTNNRVYSRAEISMIERLKELIHAHGYTLSCLKNLMAAAPCWVVFGCRDKTSCPAYRSPETVCYDQKKNENRKRKGRSCETCPIFLNRHLRPVQIF